MSYDSARSMEAQILDQYPGIRETVAGSTDFILWRDSLPSVMVEDELLYIRGGDMLRDQDQIIFEWARQHGLLSGRGNAEDYESEGGD